MKKYIINIVSARFKNDPIGGGASAKAPADILMLAKQNGYEEIDVFLYQTYGKIKQIMSLLYQLFKLSCTLERNSIVFFQYPHINPHIMPVVMACFNKYRKVAIVHDMNSIRVDGKLSDSEKKALNYFDELYVHSDNMRDYLRANLKSNLVYHVIDCFPYISEANCEERISSNTVTFAGNLDKSTFLIEFLNKNKNLDILLYGQTSDASKFTDKAKYLGRFLPDDIQHIKGSWGIVWDGENIDTCGGHYGEYLKIIAPHKFSMYLAAEMPVIVWSMSAMAELVKKYHLGVIVNNLDEIYAKIHDCEKDYNSYVQNIKYFVKEKMNRINF